MAQRSCSLLMESKILNDKNCIEQVKLIMASTTGCDIVLTGELTCWAWTAMMESMSTMRGNSLNTILESVFLSFAKSNLEGLRQAQQDHERQ